MCSRSTSAAPSPRYAAPAATAFTGRSGTQTRGPGDTYRAASAAPACSLTARAYRASGVLLARPKTPSDPGRRPRRRCDSHRASAARAIRLDLRRWDGRRDAEVGSALDPLAARLDPSHLRDQGPLQPHRRGYLARALADRRRRMAIARFLLQLRHPRLPGTFDRLGPHQSALTPDTSRIPGHFARLRVKEVINHTDDRKTGVSVNYAV